eukprot:4107016-Heterocapsa_arctica.AAC.1
MALWYENSMLPESLQLRRSSDTHFAAIHDYFPKPLVPFQSPPSPLTQEIIALKEELATAEASLRSLQRRAARQNDAVPLAVGTERLCVIYEDEESADEFEKQCAKYGFLLDPHSGATSEFKSILPVLNNSIPHDKTEFMVKVCKGACKETPDRTKSAKEADRGAAAGASAPGRRGPPLAGQPR